MTPAAGILMALLVVVPLGAEIFEQVLVKVNGEIITKSDFEQRQVAELRNRPELGNVSPNSPQPPHRDQRDHAGPDSHRGRRAAAHPARQRTRLRDGR
jgi:hypothetical protein